eukprot:1489961-Pleurochrysis_carterae.AAC.3
MCALQIAAWRRAGTRRVPAMRICPRLSKAAACVDSSPAPSRLAARSRAPRGGPAAGEDTQPQIAFLMHAAKCISRNGN